MNETQFLRSLPTLRREQRRGQTGRSKSRRDDRLNRLDFAAVNRAAMMVLPTLLARWLPAGKIEGSEYVSLNPKRADRRPGSFKVNMRTARWADFATGDCGGDVIWLAAYLGGIRQVSTPPLCPKAQLREKPPGDQHVNRGSCAYRLCHPNIVPMETAEPSD